MTVVKHLSGKHYMEYTGNRLVIWIYIHTGWKLGNIKMKLKYKGVK